MSSARIASPLCKSQHLIACISSGHYNCPVSDNGTPAGVAALALQTSTSELFCASQPRWAVVSTSSCWGPASPSWKKHLFVLSANPAASRTSCNLSKKYHVRTLGCLHVPLHLMQHPPPASPRLTWGTEQLPTEQKEAQDDTLCGAMSLC